jgi:hypothetical protein
VTATNTAALCTSTFSNVIVSGQWVQTTTADFNAGTNNGTQVTYVSGGEVQLATNSLNGTFTSAIFSAARIVTLGSRQLDSQRAGRHHAHSADA